MNIYKITNLINKKIYIGQEKKFKPEYFGSGLLIKNAIKEFGIENFIKEIIEENCKDYNELNKREIFWIKKLKSQDPHIGYNISGGGSLFIMNNEIAKKISDALKGKYTGKNSFRHGLKLTEEHKRIIGESNRGKTIKNKNITETTRKKMSEFL